MLLTHLSFVREPLVYGCILRESYAQSSMLSSSYQSALHGSHGISSSSALKGWSSHSASDKVPANVCMRASQQPLATEEKERAHPVKDVRQPNTNEGHLPKCSESVESSRYGNSVLSLSVANGLSLDTTILCDGTVEKDSVRGTTKKPSHPGRDIWRPKKDMGTVDSARKVDVWTAKRSVNPAGSKLLTEEQSATKPEESTSSQKFVVSTTSRKKSSPGKHVWRSRRTEEMNTQSVGSKGRDSRKRLYLVDIHPLCYNGSRVQPRKILDWMDLLFSEVTHDDPIIAVMDGERGNDYRRALLPSYKSHRNLFRPLAVGNSYTSAAKDVRKALPFIHGFFTLCQIPVVKQEFAEADDIIATLASQARDAGFQVVIASPDMDFRQLLSADVHMLLPLPELGRWSFYTLDHYVKQNTVSPDLELGLKCMLGDLSDNVPGLAVVAPGFGRKTALKLMQKHGSLEKLLTAAASRTVGREYIQDALTKHAELLRRNLQVLSLRTDVDVVLKEEWCKPRCVSNDVLALDLLNEKLRSG